MPPETFLILIKDDDLAAAVAAALPGRLEQESRTAAVVVPAFRRLAFASWRPGLAASELAGQVRPAGRCVAVGVCEAGLLDGIRSLGLPAWIGIPAHEPPATIRWGQRGGARLVPITAAADLIDAIAADAAWPPSAAFPASAAARPPAIRLHRGRPAATRLVLRPGAARPAALPALSRKLIIATATAGAAAGAAGSVLLATAPAATTAPAAAAHGAHPATATATLTAYSGSGSGPGPGPGPGLASGSGSSSPSIVYQTLAPTLGSAPSGTSAGGNPSGLSPHSSPPASRKPSPTSAPPLLPAAPPPPEALTRSSS